MTMFGAHLLTWLVFLPLVTAAVMLALPDRESLQRGVAFFGGILALAVSIVVFVDFRALDPGMQLTEHAPWIPSLGISWALGIDGISLFLVLLTTILTPIVIAASRTAVKSRWKEYYLFLMMLETAMLGAFLALDAVLFYVFWEAMLVPMYFLIGIWGGERRVYAAVKFFLFTAVGSLLMLVALLYVYFAHHAQTGTWSAALSDLLGTNLTRQAQMWLFAAFGLAFAIKVPLFPFHTWLPDAHTEAPTGGSVILAAVLLKMGTYGFLRWAMPLFPLAAMRFTPLLLTLGAIGVVYGALVALVQPDMKRMIAYSSVSHLGYVMLGLFALNGESVSGAVLQMINHGVSTGALFLLVGVIYERLHTREIAKFGGLARTMPMYAAILLFVTLSSIGLPGTNGFVGEFLILIGTWRAAPIAGLFGALGVVLGAVYMLWLYERVCLGPITHEQNQHVPDASWRELACLLPAIAAILFIGIYPRPLLDRIEPAVNATIERIHMASSPSVTMNVPSTRTGAEAAR